MELLKGKFEVSYAGGASLRNAWKGAKQAKKFRIKSNETGKHCFVVIYGGSMADIDEKDALYCLLSDAVDYISAQGYSDTKEYLIEEFGYEEFVEDDFGYLKRNPELTRIEKGLKRQYEKASNIIGDNDKITSLLNDFIEEYNY